MVRVIAALHQKGLPRMLEHADYLEQQLAQHGSDEATVRPSLTDDVFLRSSNGARWQLAFPLPEVEQFRATAIDREPSRPATCG